MTTDEQFERRTILLAERLRNAYRDGPVPPLRDGLDPLDAVGAYAVQSFNTARWIAEGRRVVGRKIGLTALAVQKQLGVDQPDYGILFEDMLVPNGGELPIAKMIQPKVEAEVALVLGTALSDPNTTPEAVLEATETAVAAIEIVDSRIADWKITFADTVADNGSSAFFVLGTEHKPLAGLDLRTCGMVMEINGSIVSIGAGAACLGHPLKAAAWLARMLASLGSGLKRGDVILTGALGPMAPLKAGDVVRAEIGGLGCVGFTCAPASG